MTTAAANTADIRRVLATIPTRELHSITPKHLQDILRKEGLDVTASTRVATSTLLKAAREGKSMLTKPRQRTSTPHTSSVTRFQSGEVADDKKPPVQSVGFGTNKVARLAFRLVFACGGSEQAAIQAVKDQAATLLALLED